MSYNHRQRGSGRYGFDSCGGTIESIEMSIELLPTDTGPALPIKSPGWEMALPLAKTVEEAGQYFE